jgi:hypothetical protein
MMTKLFGRGRDMKTNFSTLKAEDRVCWKCKKPIAGQTSYPWMFNKWIHETCLSEMNPALVLQVRQMAKAIGYDPGEVFNG